MSRDSLQNEPEISVEIFDFKLEIPIFRGDYKPVRLDGKTFFNDEPPILCAVVSAGSGKTTMWKNSDKFYDVDCLVYGFKAMKHKLLRRNGEWGRLNKSFRRMIRRNRDLFECRILLVHHSDMLPKCARLIGIYRCTFDEICIEVGRRFEFDEDWARLTMRNWRELGKISNCETLLRSEIVLRLRQALNGNAGEYTNGDGYDLPDMSPIKWIIDHWDEPGPEYDPTYDESDSLECPSDDSEDVDLPICYDFHVETFSNVVSEFGTFFAQYDAYQEEMRLLFQSRISDEMFKGLLGFLHQPASVKLHSNRWYRFRCVSGIYVLYRITCDEVLSDLPAPILVDALRWNGWPFDSDYTMYPTSVFLSVHGHNLTIRTCASQMPVLSQDVHTSLLNPLQNLVLASLCESHGELTSYAEGDDQIFVDSSLAQTESSSSSQSSPRDYQGPSTSWVRNNEWTDSEDEEEIRPHEMPKETELGSSNGEESETDDMSKFSDSFPFDKDHVDDGPCECKYCYKHALDAKKEVIELGKSIHAENATAPLHTRANLIRGLWEDLYERYPVLLSYDLWKETQERVERPVSQIQTYSGNKTVFTVTNKAYKQKLDAVRRRVLESKNDKRKHKSKKRVKREAEIPKELPPPIPDNGAIAVDCGTFGGCAHLVLRAHLLHCGVDVDVVMSTRKVAIEMGLGKNFGENNFLNVQEFHMLCLKFNVRLLCFVKNGESAVYGETRDTPDVNSCLVAYADDSHWYYVARNIDYAVNFIYEHNKRDYAEDYPISEEALLPLGFTYPDDYWFEENYRARNGIGKGGFRHRNNARIYLEQKALKDQEFEAIWDRATEPERNLLILREVNNSCDPKWSKLDSVRDELYTFRVGYVAEEAPDGVKDELIPTECVFEIREMISFPDNLYVCQEIEFSEISQPADYPCDVAPPLPSAVLKRRGGDPEITVACSSDSTSPSEVVFGDVVPVCSSREFTPPATPERTPPPTPPRRHTPQPSVIVEGPVEVEYKAVEIHHDPTFSDTRPSANDDKNHVELQRASDSAASGWFSRTGLFASEGWKTFREWCIKIFNGVEWFCQKVFDILTHPLPIVEYHKRSRKIRIGVPNRERVLCNRNTRLVEGFATSIKTAALISLAPVSLPAFILTGVGSFIHSYYSPTIFEVDDRSIKDFDFQLEEGSEPFRVMGLVKAKTESDWRVKVIRTVYFGVFSVVDIKVYDNSIYKECAGPHIYISSTDTSGASLESRIRSEISNSAHIKHNKTNYAEMLKCGIDVAQDSAMVSYWLKMQASKDLGNALAGEFVAPFSCLDLLAPIGTAALVISPALTYVMTAALGLGNTWVNRFHSIMEQSSARPTELHLQHAYSTLETRSQDLVTGTPDNSPASTHSTGLSSVSGTTTNSSPVLNPSTLTATLALRRGYKIPTTKVPENDNCSQPLSVSKNLRDYLDNTTSPSPSVRKRLWIMVRGIGLLISLKRYELSKTFRTSLRSFWGRMSSCVRRFCSGCIVSLSASLWLSGLPTYRICSSLVAGASTQTSSPLRSCLTPSSLSALNSHITTTCSSDFRCMPCSCCVLSSSHLETMCYSLRNFQHSLDPSVFREVCARAMLTVGPILFSKLLCSTCNASVDCARLRETTTLPKQLCSLLRYVNVCIECWVVLSNLLSHGTSSQNPFAASSITQKIAVTFPISCIPSRALDMSLHGIALEIVQRELDWSSLSLKHFLAYTSMLELPWFKLLRAPLLEYSLELKSITSLSPTTGGLNMSFKRLKNMVLLKYQWARDLMNLSRRLNEFPSKIRSVLKDGLTPGKTFSRWIIGSLIDIQVRSVDSMCSEIVLTCGTQEQIVQCPSSLLLRDVYDSVNMNLSSLWMSFLRSFKLELAVCGTLIVLSPFLMVSSHLLVPFPFNMLISFVYLTLKSVLWFGTWKVKKSTFQKRILRIFITHIISNWHMPPETSQLRCICLSQMTKICPKCDCGCETCLGYGPVSPVVYSSSSDDGIGCHLTDDESENDSSDNYVPNIQDTMNDNPDLDFIERRDSTQLDEELEIIRAKYRARLRPTRVMPPMNDLLEAAGRSSDEGDVTHIDISSPDSVYSYFPDHVEQPQIQWSGSVDYSHPSYEFMPLAPTSEEGAVFSSCSSSEQPQCTVNPGSGPEVSVNSSSGAQVVSSIEFDIDSQMSSQCRNSFNSFSS